MRTHTVVAFAILASLECGPIRLEDYPTYEPDPLVALKTSNPGGGWTAGARGGSGFYAGGTRRMNSELGLPGWGDVIEKPWEVLLNSGDAEAAFGTVRVPAKHFMLHPGSGEAVIRWTPPISGAWRIEATFAEANIGRTTTEVRISTQKRVFFSGFINLFGGGASASFNDVVQVDKGDAVYFSVAAGNSSNDSDGTSLKLNVAWGE